MSGCDVTNEENHDLRNRPTSNAEDLVFRLSGLPERRCVYPLTAVLNLLLNTLTVSSLVRSQPDSLPYYFALVN